MSHGPQARPPPPVASSRRQCRHRCVGWLSTRTSEAALSARDHGNVFGGRWLQYSTSAGLTVATLAYLVFNTIMNLTTQDAQVACFQNVAAHLKPGGRFVIEVGVPLRRRASLRLCGRSRIGAVLISNLHDPKLRLGETLKQLLGRASMTR